MTDMEVRERGPIEILANEVRFPFRAEIERVDVIAAYLRGLLCEMEHEAAIGEFVGGPISADARRIYGEMAKVLTPPFTAERLRAGAEWVDSIIDQDMPLNDEGPCDKHVELVHGLLCAIKFSLQSPCRSRHLAEAGQWVCRQRYRFGLEDSYTSDLTKRWLHDRLSAAVSEVLPRPHLWFKPERFDFESCRVCGIIRRDDDQNKPCRGPIAVKPRWLEGAAIEPPLSHGNIRSQVCGHGMIFPCASDACPSFTERLDLAKPKA